MWRSQRAAGSLSPDTMPRNARGRPHRSDGLVLSPRPHHCSVVVLPPPCLTPWHSVWSTAKEGDACAWKRRHQGFALAPVRCVRQFSLRDVSLLCVCVCVPDPSRGAEPVPLRAAQRQQPALPHHAGPHYQGRAVQVDPIKPTLKVESVWNEALEPII